VCKENKLGIKKDHCDESISEKQIRKICIKMVSIKKSEEGIRSMRLIDSP